MVYISLGREVVFNFCFIPTVVICLLAQFIKFVFQDFEILSLYSKDLINPLDQIALLFIDIMCGIYLSPIYLKEGFYLLQLF